MTDFATLLQQGTANAWLFIPSAILLGALHGEAGIPVAMRQTVEGFAARGPGHWPQRPERLVLLQPSMAA